MTPKLRVIVVDDERPARVFLLNLLQSFDDIVVAGVAASGEEALELIENERPDLLLLDVHMPSLDGFGVVHLLNESTMPLVAFVTAFDDYADLAREVGAIDFLHKPVDKSQLRRTITRARQRIERMNRPDTDDEAIDRVQPRR